MLSIKKITDLKYKNQLKDMCVDYYNIVCGKDFGANIPFLDKYLNFNKQYAQEAVDEIFSESLATGIAAQSTIGLFNDEELIAFASLAVFSDNVGGIYKIYVKPEYRHQNVGDNPKAIELLKQGITEYFKSFNLSAVILEVPHTVEYLNLPVIEEGFEPVKVHSDATEYKKSL